MEIDINWFVNEDSRWRIKANTVTEVRRALNSHKIKGKKRWGYFDGLIILKLSPNKKRIRLNAYYTITLPEWPGSKTQQEDIQDKWDKMLKALKTHEYGHKEIMERAVNKLKSDLEGLPTINIAKLNKLASKANKEMNEAHNKYDKEKEAGKLQGVEF